MRVFVTGATGFVGQAVVRELLGAGHSVLGLARTDEAAESLKAEGAEVHRGDLHDLEALTAAAKATDGTAHLAFIHDFTKFGESIATDRRAVETLIAALEGTGKPLVVTSGIGVLQSTTLVDESVAAPSGPDSGRAGTEAVVLSAADRGVRAMILRLPPTTHGAGDHGFIPFIIAKDRQHAAAAFIGDGSNRWAACHRNDAARLYRLALEKGAAGTRLHAVAEQGIPFHEIAATIGQGLNLPTKGLSPEQAPAHFEWMARFAAMNMVGSSEQTRQTFNWQPTEIGLLEDIRQNYLG